MNIIYGVLGFWGFGVLGREIGIPLKGWGNNPLSAPALETKTFLALEMAGGTGPAEFEAGA